MRHRSVRAFTIRHTTTYRYARPVRLGPHVVRLRPTPAVIDRVHAYGLEVTPEPAALRWQLDPLSNWTAQLLFAEPADELRVVAHLTIDQAPVDPFAFLVEPASEHWPSLYSESTRREVLGFLDASPAGPALQALLAPRVARGAVPSLPMVLDLNREIAERITYETRPEGEVQDPEVTLARGAGSCRDSAWLLVQVLRNLGWAARFVSGYLLPPFDGPERPTLDSAGMHAWASAYLPGPGWLDLDPTTGLLCNESYVPLAATAHYAAAAPIEGTSELQAADVAFDFHVEISAFA